MRFKLVVLLLVFAGVNINGAEGQSVVLKKGDIRIAKNKIYLNDIAEFEGVSEEIRDKLTTVYLKRAALPGYAVTITKNMVINKVRKRVRYVKVTGKDRVRVYTEKGTVSRPELNETAKDFIMNNMPWEKEEAEIELRGRKGGVVVVKGDISLKVRQDNKVKFKGNVVVPVEIYVNSKFYKIEPVPVLVTVNTECLVAKKDIRRKETVDEGMVKKAKKDITYLRGGVIRHSRYLKNKVTKRAVMKGSILLKSMFERVPLFRRGAKVAVVVKVKGISVESYGVAFKDGREGDKVKVKLVTGKTVEGTVNGEGRVIIKR